MRAQVTVLIVALSVATAMAYRQPLEFELVSIRHSPPKVVWTGTTTLTNPTSFVVVQGGRFEARGQTLENLARVAYGFEKVRPGDGVVSAPASWVLNDRFDVTASADQAWGGVTPGVIPSELRTMLQTLLATRFELEAHVDTRNVQGYALRRVKGKRGVEPPGLRPSQTPCAAATDPSNPELMGGSFTLSQCITRNDLNHLEANGLTMTEIARALFRFQFMNMPVVVEDQSGLQGTYDLALSLVYGAAPVPVTQYQPQQAPAISTPNLQSSEELLRQGRGRVLPGEVKKQLGLELVRADVKTRVLVIEKAKKPKED